MIHNATVTARDDLTPSTARFTIRPDRTQAVEAGQYLSFGLLVEGRILQRPYSAATPAGANEELEFLVRLVPGGAFTPRLWALREGDRLYLGPPKGLFVRLPRDDRTHLFIATGTGLAPFMAMASTLIREPAPPPMVLIHGVALVAELAWRERIERWSVDGAVTYVPSISRPDADPNAGWDGRTGRIDAILEAVCTSHGLVPDRTVAYLCGNPEMIVATRRILGAFGLPEDAIRSEQYWPA